jgi:hypothetical protein
MPAIHHGTTSTGGAQWIKEAAENHTDVHVHDRHYYSWLALALFFFHDLLWLTGTYLYAGRQGSAADFAHHYAYHQQFVRDATDQGDHPKPLLCVRKRTTSGDDGVI